MSLSTEQTLNIAKLARLDLPEADVAPTLVKLNSILDLIEQMQAVDTRDVAPMSHPQDVAQRLRDDTVTEADQRDHFQQIAPQTENGLYLVPKVIE